MKIDLSYSCFIRSVLMGNKIVLNGGIPELQGKEKIKVEHAGSPYILCKFSLTNEPSRINSKLL